MSLPKVDIENNLAVLVYHVESEEYVKMTKDLQGYIISDCWAVTIDINNTSEILFNSYNTSNSYRDIMINDLIREKLETNIHKLLSRAMRKKLPFEVKIYMFQLFPWCVHVSYDPIKKEYSNRLTHSQEYYDRYKTVEWV